MCVCVCICMYEPPKPNCKSNNRMGNRRNQLECISSKESLRVKMNKGAWTSQEDEILKNYVSIHGDRKWSLVAQNAGLNRCGKSCRLRWLNYLRPGIKRGHISPDEEDLIIRLHRLLGNRWSLIAGRLPGRTDNEIKNYWHTVLAKKKLQQPEILPSPKAGLSNIQRLNYNYSSSSLSSEKDEDNKTKEMATTNNSSNVALISRDFGHLDQFSENDPTTWDVLNFDFLLMNVSMDHNDSIIGSSSSPCNATHFHENEMVMDSSCGSVTSTTNSMGDDQFSIFHNELKKVVSFLELEEE